MTKIEKLLHLQTRTYRNSVNERFEGFPLTRISISLMTEDEGAAAAALVVVVSSVVLSKARDALAKWFLRAGGQTGQISKGYSQHRLT